MHLYILGCLVDVIICSCLGRSVLTTSYSSAHSVEDQQVKTFTLDRTQLHLTSTLPTAV